MFWDLIPLFCPLRSSIGSTIVGFAAYSSGQNGVNLGLSVLLNGTKLLGGSWGIYRGVRGERRGGAGNSSAQCRDSLRESQPDA